MRRDGLTRGEAEVMAQHLVAAGYTVSVGSLRVTPHIEFWWVATDRAVRP